MRTAGQIAADVRAGRESPVAIVEDALRRAEAWQPVTNAFSQLHADEAMEEARDRAERLARGEDLGPLAGVPVTVKDLFDVAGWETSGCSAAFRGTVARSDAEAVRRVRAAGAVVIGKTNQHELAAGATNLVSACGATRNPWDPDRITGGSSGGSAAAVAAGIVPVALGTDTGGSIRIPAAMCGTVGLKPTYGGVSLWGAMPLAPSMDTAGPLTSTADDADLVFSVLAERVEPRLSLEEVTVGILERGFGTRARPDLLDATHAAADVLADAGSRISAAEVTGIDDALELWEKVAWAEFASIFGDVAGQVHHRTREILEFGLAHQSELELSRARAAEIRTSFLHALEDADALLCPATPFAAPSSYVRLVSIGVDELDVRRGAPSNLTRPVNLAGLPAVAFPIGFSDEGLPLGAQLIGRPGGEGVLLSLVHSFQERTDHHVNRREELERRVAT
ncbi:MAG TPA: amidase [Actinomycetota bacterium]|nr:amidase [Actinomycetota bacterium]